MKYFGTAGIRGKYPEFVSSELAYRLGLAIAKYTEGKDSFVNIAWDVRTTSKLLALSSTSGVLAGGSNALLLGMLPLPVLAYSVPRFKSKAGMMITASHNPPQDNGIKIFDERGMEYTEKSEEGIEHLMESFESLLAPWDSVGNLYSRDDTISHYLEDLYNRFSHLGPSIQVKVIIDCGNGCGSLVTPTVLKLMGAKVYSLNCNTDGFFPGRYPEPRPDVLMPFHPLLISLGGHVYLAHDGDADRLGVMTPSLGFVKQDYIIALYAQDKLSERRGKVIVSPDVGNSVYDIVEELGGRIIIGKLGRLHEKLHENPDAALVAEPWKLIDPEWGPWVDGIYQAAYLLNIMYKYKMTLEEIIKKLPRYYWARADISFPSHEEKRRVSAKVLADIEYMKGEIKEIIRIDGIRINFQDRSWVLVRPSGTEPKLRIYLEADNKSRYQEIKNAVLDIIKRNAELLSTKILDIKINEGI